MARQYLISIWMWVSTAFVKVLGVWGSVIVLTMVWTRFIAPTQTKKIHADDVDAGDSDLPASLKREAALSILIMVIILALLFAFQPLMKAVDDVSLWVRWLVINGTTLLMCVPVIVVLVIRRQRLESVMIYALWHLPRFLRIAYNGITMLVQFMALFVLGLALGIIRHRTKSIIPSALFHASSDIAQTLW
jgi:hypothetical protein